MSEEVQTEKKESNIYVIAHQGQTYIATLLTATLDSYVFEKPLVASYGFPKKKKGDKKEPEPQVNLSLPIWFRLTKDRAFSFNRAAVMIVTATPEVQKAYLTSITPPPAAAPVTPPAPSKGNIPNLTLDKG